MKECSLKIQHFPLKKLRKIQKKDVPGVNRFVIIDKFGQIFFEMKRININIDQ